MQNEIEVEFALQHFYYNYHGAMYAKRPDEPKKEKKEKKKTSKACNVLVVTASRESCAVATQRTAKNLRHRRRKTERKREEGREKSANKLSASLNIKRSSTQKNCKLFFCSTCTKLASKINHIKPKKKIDVTTWQQSKVAATIEGCNVAETE